MSIKLMPHNQQAYTKVKEMLKKENKAAIIQPTGTGKSYIALKLIEEKSDKKIIYLVPSNSIIEHIEEIIEELQGNVKRHNHGALCHIGSGFA